MKTQKPLPPSANGRRKNGLQTALESRQLNKKASPEYKRFIQGHYDGLAGKLTGLTGILTGHEVLAGYVFKPKAFDLRGCKRILDAGCGNGRYSRFILKQADADAFITGFDLSQRMLKRARRRIPNPRISLSAADLTRLPYPDAFFDALVCGWVLEHLLDPRPGLKELARVLAPGGKFLLMTTEDTLTGSVCSRLWHCRTYGRDELARFCDECSLHWKRELYFSQVHKFFRLGGIIVELRKA
jgi:ubiquinone/menaquinone biosynthesis C-methylase UbiE